VDLYRQPGNFRPVSQQSEGVARRRRDAEVTTKAEVRAAGALTVPVVNISGALRDPGLPRVMVDHLELGRMAAEHLLERGFRRFGYYGLHKVWYSELRGRGFTERVILAGAECRELETISSIGRRRPWHGWLDELTGWLKELAPPVGLFAVHDYRARMVVDACYRAGLRVPDDVAVIGVNNDEITCEFCEPPLSSVSRNGRQVGCQAAALLDRLMSGRRPPRQEMLVVPGACAVSSNDSPARRLPSTGAHSTQGECLHK